MNKKEDEDMPAVEDKYEAKDKDAKKYEFDNDCIKEIVASKETIIVKNGVMKINPSHPDYDFWMED
ncbi:hypothetical protein ABNX05_11605 [Lysinibacillus sp. M3]|uniref:Uncharacterized protein n=1 Tax=Lysinibacillus zambalensis TaxID=3160866 RepID=A0ABV1MRW8_9BACI